MEAVQDLLVLFGLVVELLQVGRAVAGILGQHELDVATERKVLGEEEEHFGQHVGAEAAVRVMTLQG